MVQTYFDRMTETFGSMSDPFDWHGANEPVVKEALRNFQHVIDRAGLLTGMMPRDRLMAEAYFAGKLLAGKDLDTVMPPVFRTKHTSFGIIALLGTKEAAEPILGVPYEDGFVKVENEVEIAHFVSVQGVCATLRSPIGCGRQSYMLNDEGATEMALQPMLTDVAETIREAIS